MFVCVGKSFGNYEGKLYYSAYFLQDLPEGSGEGQKPVLFRKGESYKSACSVTKECFDKLTVGEVYDNSTFLFDRFGKLAEF